MYNKIRRIYYLSIILFATHYIHIMQNYNIAIRVIY